MKGTLAIFTFACAAALVSIPAAAQWAVYEKPTAEDWAALAKLPDFSGVWERGGGGGGARGAGAPPGGAPRAGGAPRGGGGAAGPRAGGGAAGARGGGRGGGPVPTPEYAALRDQLRAAGTGPSQMANCLPPAMPSIMGQPYPMEFLMTPGKVTIILEAFTQVRHIFTDGRELPEFPDPTFFGTSVGRWEGDTLVVESVGFNDFVQLGGGIPHSDELKITERIRLIGEDVMSIETTFTDPKALQEPYTTTATFARHRDWTLAEYICQENNRNFVDSEGREGIVLDNPGGVPPPRN